ncbi:MAG: glycerophosphodiester phosphodiesterase [Hydrogenophaga sp.]|uniref:glycerophosphodiester phosphodiesterase n=1 Tax=Hydrogenophaga sp. TaxID=1904254 RepID=UPI00271EAFE0|nr:glycerophosphodiester phosphodiesterase [Hydrogenophaga sp.]MDO9480299.1 glycerophosphodiester phosphodiesterase [Hydrogenophaga sp.]MDP3343368.1 glycerophosphodiester phosphodiesterase [Hydrogenophaga sp.]MDP3808156.1 glycerophosphodiester phosphodiesterase [Hydrogenophaga sp.]MDZ4239339.1 glycerophosphodiester phosphodiesterase [Hydrogenophaga sp.]
MPTHITPSTAAKRPWPYPRWIAHRGAGLLAPENTLAAFRRGAQHGYRMFECDVKLSADGVAFLLHDDTLERTTDGQGVAGNHTWAALSQLDAGAWHSPACVGETLPTLAAVARWCMANGYGLNIEIKPTPGSDWRTGRAVAQAAATLWANHAQPPLLSSFQPEALAGAQETAPALPRGLLLETLWTGWLDAALALGCQAVVCEQGLWTEALMHQVRGAGLHSLAYTVNDATAAQRLLALGLDSIITDRVDRFAPDA